VLLIGLSDCSLEGIRLQVSDAEGEESGVDYDPYRRYCNELGVARCIAYSIPTLKLSDLLLSWVGYVSEFLDECILVSPHGVREDLASELEVESDCLYFQEPEAYVPLLDA